MSDDAADDLAPAAPLNDLAWDLVHQILNDIDELGVIAVDQEDAGIVLDFGVEAPGSLGAGLALAEVCLAGLCQLSIVPGSLGGTFWPSLFVQTDHPLEACLFSQYAGWQLSAGKYFGMGSGPMRAAAQKELLFDQLQYREDASGVVGVIESRQLPTPEIIQLIARACRVEPQQVALLVAPTASLAGNLQIVARSVETALHQLHERGFDVRRIHSACGVAPISPVAVDDLSGIGRTNDAILYGGRVTLWVSGDDESIREVGPLTPSCGSPAFGQPFLEIFEAAGRDFYKVDPRLFAPAEVVFHNLDTGRVQAFGGVREDVIRRSFGLD